MFKKGLIYMGNPILRSISKEVINIKSNEIKTIVNKLREITKIEDAAGVAAPQVGHNLRLFSMINVTNDAEMQDEENESSCHKIIINPKIIEKSSTFHKDFEGCLSIPGLIGLVSRPENVQVEYQNMDGKIIHETLSGFPSRVFQHEFDHLDGILYLDKAIPKTILYKKELLKLEEYQVTKLYQYD